MSVVVNKIDGVRRPAWTTSPVGPLLVDSGSRTIDVSGSIVGPPGFMYVADAELKVTLQANHSYVIHGSWKDQAMTFWLEDETTGKLVGESRTIPASLDFRP